MRIRIGDLLVKAGVITEAQLKAAYEAEWADEWDSADSSAYMDRVEAGLEPGAEQ